MKIKPSRVKALKRKGKAKVRAIRKVERMYAREVQKLLNDWFADWLRRLSLSTGVKFNVDSKGECSYDLFTDLNRAFNTDALSDKLGPLFDEAIEDLNLRVDRFVVRIKKRANNIAALAQLRPTAISRVELFLDPRVLEPWLTDEITDHAARNSRLIKKVGIDVMAQVEALALAALKEPTSVPKLAKKIGAISKKLENRAKLIARDQIAKLQQGITKMRAKRAGSNRYLWQSSGDERVRSKHISLDGTIREFGQGIEPGDEVACRCVAIILFDDDIII